MANKKPSNISASTGKRKKMALKSEQHITDQTAFKQEVKECKAGDKGGNLSCEDWARTQVWPDKWKKGPVKGKIVAVKKKKKK